MKPKLLGCLAATAMGTAIVMATPAMTFGGGGHGGGGHMMSMGGGHFGPMFAGRSMAMGGFNRDNRFERRFSRFDRDDRFRHFHHFRNRSFNGFNNFAFFGVPFAYHYSAFGNGCWRWDGWQWSNICYVGYNYVY